MSVKIPGLAGLRWLACLNVILYHLNQHRSNANLGLFDWSMYQYTEALAISVSFFFIIGGLFRSIPYWRTIYMNESMLDTKHTLIDRFWRIAPPYYAALIVSFLLALILGISGPDAIMRLVSGLAFLSWVHPSTLFPVDINGPLWYVSYDIMGLLIVMGIMIFLVKIPKKYISLGLFGSGALLLGLHFVFIHIPFPVSDGVANAWFPTYNPFLFGLHFLIGIVIGWGYIVGETNKRANSFVYDIIASVAFISILVFLWNIREAADFDYSWPRWPYRFPLVPVLLAIGIFSLRYSVRVGHWLDNALFSWIAKISYGVYLWQAIFIVTLQRFLFPGYEQLPMQQWIILVTLSLACSFGAGWLSYTYLEVGVTKWRKKWMK